MNFCGAEKVEAEEMPVDKTMSTHYTLNINICGVKNMPSISMFYGIIIYMYFKDNKQHKLPHIHAVYGEYEAVFEINGAGILDGEFPVKEKKFVETWILLRQKDLLANWKLAVSGEVPYKVEPLR